MKSALLDSKEHFQSTMDDMEQKMESRLFQAIIAKVQHQHKLRRSRVKINAKNTTNDIMKNLFDERQAAEDKD